MPGCAVVKLEISESAGIVQSESEGPTPGDGMKCVLSQSPDESKVGWRRPVSQLRDSEAEGMSSPFLYLSVVFRPPKPTHTGEGNLLYSVYRFTLTDTCR